MFSFFAKLTERDALGRFVFQYLIGKEHLYFQSHTF